jgi:hypothetical protein
MGGEDLALPRQGDRPYTADHQASSNPRLECRDCAAETGLTHVETSCRAVIVALVGENQEAPYCAKVQIVRWLARRFAAGAAS